MTKLKHLLILAALALTACAGKQEEVAIHGEADIAGHRIGTLAGSCYDIQLSPRKDIKLSLFSTVSDCAEAVKSGKVDAILVDEVAFSQASLKQTGLKKAFLQEDSFPTAFAFRKEDTALTESFNQFLRELKESGTLERMREYWFESKELRPEEFPQVETYTTGEPLRYANGETIAPIAFFAGGTWNGFEIELARRFAAYLKRPIQIDLFEFSSMIVSLQLGKADMIGGAIFVTEERQQQVAFGDPYYDVHPAYFIKDIQAARAKKEPLHVRVANAFRQNFIVENRWRMITDGLLTTLLITFWSILIGSLLGILLCLMALSQRKGLRAFVNLYDGFMHGIPMLVLLLIMFYVILARTGWDARTIAIVAFALNFASAAGGVFTTSVESVPRGQTEAGLALGFTRLRTFLNIVLPQAVRKGLPLYKGECISLLKGTSIVGYIAVIDVTRASDLVRSRTFDAFMPLLAVTIIYFVLAWLIGLLLNYLTLKARR
ncbi:MAG: ABC transporter permease subunit [Bacteroidales bacterium]|nr:ABC transporter permease subunit [Bacteroidales bacterium]